MVIAAALVIALAILGVTAGDLYSRHGSIVADSERRVRGYNSMLTEQVARSFEAIDRTLIAAAAAREDYYLRGEAGQSLPPHELLSAILHGSPLLSGMSWVDAHGTRTHASLGPILAPLNVSTQEQFTVHRDSPNVGFFISHPFRSVLDGRWLILVSRRLENPNGSFAGIVQASLDIDYLDRTYSQMSIGEGMTIGLFRDDGTILIRTPNTRRDIGLSVADSPNFNMTFRGEPSGLIRGTNPRDGRDGPRRVGAFSVVPGLPLVAVVSLQLDVALQRWLGSLYVMVPAATVLAILVLSVGLLFARQLARNDRQRIDLMHATQHAEAAQAEALHASQAKSAFLASMSHELRTPLNAVIGYGQLLQLDTAASRAQRDHADAVLKGGYHLLELVNQVLDMAGIESGKLKLDIESVAVASKLDSVRRTMLPLAEKKGIPVEVEVEAGIPDVRADLMRLRQVLLNLTSNAIKYNRPGGTVRLEAWRTASGRIRFTVEDTGPGIPRERQGEIFKPFARLGAEFTSTEGTGLGLAISKQIVESMGGRIEFESTPGAGSRFWFELPAATAETATPGTASETKPDPSSPTAPARTHSVLYVEDVPENLRLVALLCATRPGLTMLPAPTPEEGLRLALAHRPDVIILDINLPGMDGYEVLSRLRTMPETSDIPVLALTAAAMPDNVKRGLQAGFFRYLTKPLDVTSFFQAIDDALAQRAGQAGRASGAAA